MLRWAKALRVSFIPCCVREPSNEARQVDGVLGALGAAVLVPPEVAAVLVLVEPVASALGAAAAPESTLVVVGLAAGAFFAPPESVL